MSRQPIIPPQPDNGKTPEQRFADFSRRILSVPKPEIDRIERREANSKKHKPKI